MRFNASTRSKGVPLLDGARKKFIWRMAKLTLKEQKVVFGQRLYLSLSIITFAGCLCCSAVKGQTVEVNRLSGSNLALSREHSVRMVVDSKGQIIGKFAGPFVLMRIGDQDVKVPFGPNGFGPQTLVPPKNPPPVILYISEDCSGPGYLSVNSSTAASIAVFVSRTASTGEPEYSIAVTAFAAMPPFQSQDFNSAFDYRMSSPRCNPFSKPFRSFTGRALSAEISGFAPPFSVR
jgi:hypothetical protein